MDESLAVNCHFVFYLSGGISVQKPLLTLKNFLGLSVGLVFGLSAGCGLAIKGADVLEQYEIFKYEGDDDDDDDDDDKKDKKEDKD